MSGTPKKPHEEVGHSSSSSKYLQEETGTAFPNLGGKLSPPVVAVDQYHATIEMGPDAWMSKISRTDSRDAGKKSPLHSIYRIPLPSSNDPHLDNTMTINSATESSLELRDPKDNKESKGVENRESKVEARERDSLNSKGEKDERFENRGVDGKEIKHNWDSKGEIKYDWPHQSYWKEAREHNKGYTDKSYTPFSSMAGPVEGVKDSLPTDEKDYTEAREAVGENKIDDKFKEKDRKRKDGKHRDRVEKGDRRSLPPGNNYNEGKDLMREDREPDRWASERKDFPKENERIKEREIEHNKTEKEAAHSEKDLGDGSLKMLERDNLASEQKRRKDIDGWKNLDKDGGEVKKERDVDLDGERPEKRIRYSDKDSDEGCAEAEGGTEKEKEAFNYGVQQRKRMLRPRGSPLSNRESRYKSEGSQGKPDVSTVVYKVGECMQELIKLWKEYEADKKSESSQSGPTLEIRIPAEYVTATNRQVRGGQLWGTDIYTDDSDLVAVLMHTGYCRPTASPPPPSIQELGATIRVLPPQDCYVSTLRNNVRSRAWGAAIGCSYRVERCCIVKKGGGTIDLEPCLTHTSTVEPTLAPVAVERTMTTRAAASNALRQQRFVREVTIQYNLCNEPWIKYSISIVADKGLKKPMYTSARLKKGEVLYLETHSQRYELCFSGEKVIRPSVSSQVHETEADKAQNNHLQTPNGERSLAESENVIFDAFRWSRCKKALPQRVMRSVGIPLPLDYVEVLEENIDWEDIEWSQTGVYIAKKEYALARVHFLSPN